MTDLWKNESNEWRSKCPFIRSFIPFVRRLRDGLLWQGQPKCIVHRLRCRHLAPPVPCLCSVCVLCVCASFFLFIDCALGFSLFPGLPTCIPPAFLCVSCGVGTSERERERAQLRSCLLFCSILFYLSKRYTKPSQWQASRTQPHVDASLELFA